jgi:hypothetical protein
LAAVNFALRSLQHHFSCRGEDWWHIVNASKNPKNPSGRPNDEQRNAILALTKAYLDIAQQRNGVSAKEGIALATHLGAAG